MRNLLFLIFFPFFGLSQLIPCDTIPSLNVCPCPMIYNPVCGCDNVTYGNDCEAICQGVTNWVQGPCSISNTCQSFFTYDIDTFSIIAGQSFANVQFNDESTNASWWQWDISDGSTYLIQNPYHEFDLSLTNSFEVCLLSVNLDGSCSDTYCDSIFFEVSTTNIFNYNSNEIKIYPNPFNEYVTIETNYGRDYQIIIYDAFGREIESTNCYKSKTHITSLNENGVYILTINESGKLIYREKLILIK